MKRAFTLVELLVVVVVIAILASIVFKIGSIGSDSTARNRTVERIQRLENALSGYYAAFGSYPPVQLQGRSRNPFYETNDYGVQQVSQDPAGSIDMGTDRGWKQIEAACRAQPVSMEFPYDSREETQNYITAVSEALKELYKDNATVSKGFDGLKETEQLSSHKTKADWTETQLFKFGLMSYLLPRYLIMMGRGTSTGSGQSESVYDDYAQWSDNNDMPSRFEDGTPYKSWSDLNGDLGKTSEKWKVALLPSQSVTARWLVNFKNALACKTNQRHYGVDLRDYNEEGGISIHEIPKIYSAGDSQSGTGGSGSQQYVLNEITMRDGWERDLYYYSLPPYQSYRIWSAGPNGKTFPPWISPEELSSGPLSSYRQLVQNWTADDIVQLKN